MEYKKDCQKMNLISKNVRGCKNDFENLEYFIKRWKEKIKELKNLNLNNDQAYHIGEDFANESLMKFFYKDSIKNKSLLLDQLWHDVSIALFQANNNHKKQFPSFWHNLSKLKLPSIHFHKK